MLISLAVDFRIAMLTTRERYHLDSAAQAELMRMPLPAPIEELAFVSTCNRLELFAVIAEHAPEREGWQMLSRLWMRDPTDARELLHLGIRRRGEEVARHLLRVSSGLDSQILGDAQILGQVRQAYREADQGGVIGPVLHRLFDRALHTGKRIQHETSLVGGRQSVGAEAAAVIARELTPLARRRCVVVGCGKTGERAARQLVRHGAADIVLINRTAARAHDLAAQIWGRASTYDAVHREAAEAHAIVVATGADHHVLRADALGFCREQAGTAGQPLLILDLGMPRNVDPGVRELEGVQLVDLDSLHPQLASAEALRKAAVPRADGIVEEEVAEFMVWLDTAPARDVIRPLREVLAELCRREVAYAAGDDAANRAADRIVAKLLARPMMAIRTASMRGERVEELTEAMRTLFGVTPDDGDRRADHPLAESEP